MKTINVQYLPGKVMVAWVRPMYKSTVERAQRLARLWWYGGWRISGFEMIVPDSFAMDGDETWRSVTVTKSKYLVNDLETETRWIPAKVADDARYDFPVSRAFINDVILGPAGLNSHSFRRGLAVALRIQLNEMGFTSKAKLRLLLPIINQICGWSPYSEMFFSYIGDFAQHSNLAFPNIILYLVRKRRERYAAN